MITQWILESADAFPKYVLTPQANTTKSKGDYVP